MYTSNISLRLYLTIGAIMQYVVILHTDVIPLQWVFQLLNQNQTFSYWTMAPAQFFHQWLVYIYVITSFCYFCVIMQDGGVCVWVGGGGGCYYYIIYPWNGKTCGVEHCCAKWSLLIPVTSHNNNTQHRCLKCTNMSIIMSSHLFNGEWKLVLADKIAPRCLSELVLQLNSHRYYLWISETITWLGMVYHIFL